MERWKSFPFTINLVVQDSESGVCSGLGWDRSENHIGRKESDGKCLSETRCSPPNTPPQGTEQLVEET